MTIANSGHDENGKYHGGKAGDQTGGEWEIRSWYNRPWNAVARFDKAVGADIAKLAKNAANNDKIGYDQYQRTTFWKQLKAAKDYDPKNITTACEADCSAGVAAIVKAVGYRKKLEKLKAVSEDMWTGNEVAQLRKAGATILTDPKYLTSASYLVAGDILINESHHTAINLTTGNKANATAEKPAEKPQTAPAPVSAKYQVTAKSGLNYRAGAGASYAIRGAYYYGKTVTITETKTVNGEKWGKATNGYWSSMKWLRKL